MRKNQKDGSFVVQEEVMGDDFTLNGLYAGDAAWKEWFEKCAVSRCGESASARLCAQVSSAMFSQLSRYGLKRDDVCGDDPVSMFDSYFKLKGSRETGKPLKLYFAHRIRAERLRMIDFVCGTLFGALSGRVHDIVIDWIATLKGWKPRSMRGEDGRRRLVWENAGSEDVAELERADTSDPAALLDIEPIRTKSMAILESVARKIKVEKQSVALLYYATAQDIPITATAVLEVLGTAKSRAYALREKAMEALRRELKTDEDAASPLFARMFLEVCEAALGEDVRAKLGGAE